MHTTRRGFLGLFGAAVVGLTLALPTRTFGYEEPRSYKSGEWVTIRVGGAIDALALRAQEKRNRLLNQIGDGVVGVVI